MVLLNRSSLPPVGLRCRQIDEADIETVASFLARGFPAHDRGFWLDAFARLTKHEPPPGLPEYGYLLESDRVVVGTILLICSTLPADGATTTVAGALRPPIQRTFNLQLGKLMRVQATRQGSGPHPSRLCRGGPG
jgi:hypothetical protein